MPAKATVAAAAPSKPSHNEASSSSAKQPAAATSPSEQARTTLLKLPPPALDKILRYVIGIPDGTLTADPATLRRLHVLVQTSQSMRNAVRDSISGVRFDDGDGNGEVDDGIPFWPSVKLLSSTAWPTLSQISVSVPRTRLIALLSWLAPASELRKLQLRVTGAPHADARHAQLERLQLTRLFTATANTNGLLELVVDGVDSHALLFSALFHCSSLRVLCVGPAAAHDAPATLINLLSLVVLVNARTIRRVDAPVAAWRARMAHDAPDGQRLAAACAISWRTLWSAFSSGLKESAVNMGSNTAEEKRIVDNYKAMSARIEMIGKNMQERLVQFAHLANGVPSDQVPWQLLAKVVPDIDVRDFDQGISEDDKDHDIRR